MVLTFCMAITIMFHFSLMRASFNPGLIVLEIFFFKKYLNMVVIIYYDLDNRKEKSIIK